MIRRRFVLSAAGALVAAPSIARAQAAFTSAKATYRLVTLSRGLEQPWGMAFLPDGRTLITERPGRLRVFANGRLDPTPVAGVPKVFAGGQAGLLDICLHPSFDKNKVLYLSFIAGNDRHSVTSIARAELGERGLVDVKTIFEAQPGASGRYNLGSRIVFDNDGLMYASTGDRFQMMRAQDLGDLAGKIVRLKDDGSIPADDNPFVNKPGARPEIFTWGNRNPQGLARHPTSGKIWEVEHGPKGGDELNILKPGANYGWPLATHGVNYDGSTITDKTSLPGMEDSLRWWVPSISPCGLCFYTGDKFPGWRGSLFTGALSNDALFRIEVDGEGGGEKYRGEERLLVGQLPFIRDVRQGPDGFLYLVTQADDGGLYRLEPA